MKRILIIFIVLPVLLFGACAASFDNNARLESGLLSNTDTALQLSADKMDGYLKLFLGVDDENPDGTVGSRQPFSESEKLVAQRIKEFAQSFVGEDGKPVYTVEVRGVNSDEGSSQNVIVQKKDIKEGKQVIIGTNYDNITQSASMLAGASSDETITAGALENGTGCAFMYALIDYYKDVTLDFNIVFVFFGASNIYNAGAQKFVDEMTETEVQNTLLMINPHRFGGRNVYLYTDEVKTGHQPYIKSIAQSAGSVFTEIPTSLPVISGRVTNRYPYTTWALVGVHAPFMDKYINVASVYSADYSFFYVSDSEYNGYENRSYTKSDTYTALKKDLPDFSKQMSDTAAATIALLNDSNFESEMQSSRAELKRYAWALNPMLANLSVMILITGLGVLLVILIRRFDKKYPFKPADVKKINIPVFGSDYENKPGENSEKNDENPFADY